MNQTVINPKNEIGVLRRALHVLSLLQNDDEQWNNSTLSGTLQDDPSEKLALDHSNIQKLLNGIIQNDFKIEIDRAQGVKTVRIAEDIDKETLVSFLSVYANFVVYDSARNAVFSALAEKNSRLCLWVLARIFFASKRGKYIQFSYCNNKMETKVFEVKPYHMVYRNNNLYLVAQKINEDTTSLFILSRITGLTVLTNGFEPDESPDPEKIFEHSLGSFVSDTIYDFKVGFNPVVRNKLADAFGGLDPEFRKEKENSVMLFSACDVDSVCKQLFLYGNDVEIISPESARKTMIDMLEKSLKVYKK